MSFWQQLIAAKWCDEMGFQAVTEYSAVCLDSLENIDSQKKYFDVNLNHFLSAQPFMHVLLWGPRGTGKSSMVRAFLTTYHSRGLRGLQLETEQLHKLPHIVDLLRREPHYFVIFLDDLSVQRNTDLLQFLKRVMEGGFEAPAKNIMLVATSNRRHVVPEFKSDNEGVIYDNGALHLGEEVEDALALADRFGLWISFHPMPVNDYLAFVYKLTADLKLDANAIKNTAMQFAGMRGVHSARTAVQFNIWVRQQALE